MNVQRAIVWFRQDLRLHDNEALTEALKNAEEILPVYIFDERIFSGRTCQFDFHKTGPLRAKFIIEAVEDLRKKLRKHGNELIVRVGKPEEIIPQLVKETRASWVYCNRERTTEEVQVQDELERRLWTIGREIRYTRGKMLYYTADLPFPITHTPDNFLHFRKEIERIISVRNPLGAPENIPLVKTNVTAGLIPSITDFGHKKPTASLSIKGGESEALKRLNYFFWESDMIKDFKTTHNEIVGQNHSSNFSSYLAQGCLSPKLIYTELKRYEEKNGASKSTHALFLELLRRDYFRLMAKKYEEKIFLRCGTNSSYENTTNNDWPSLRLWTEGKTGVSFIDSSMQNLNNYGLISNKSRQNTASYLINDLKVNWQMGAEYFESMLIDYDVSSNWGNWNIAAGLKFSKNSKRINKTIC